MTNLAHDVAAVLRHWGSGPGALPFRSATWLAGPLLLGFALFAVLRLSELTWLGTRTASQTAVFALVLLGPVLSALGALDMWRFTDDSVRAVTRSTTRGTWLPVHIALANAFGALVIVLIVICGAIALALPGTHLSIDPFLLVELVLAVVAYASVGVAAGALVRSVFMAPVIGTSVYVLPWLLYDKLTLPILDSPGSSAVTPGEVRSWLWTLFADGMWALLAVTCLAMAVWALGLWPRWPVGLLGGAFVATFVVAQPALGDSYGSIPAPNPPRVCAGAAPQVCVLRGHERLLGPLNEQLSKAYAVLGEHGLPLPGQLRENVSGSDGGTRGNYTSQYPYSAGHFDLYQLTGMLLSTDHCRHGESVEVQQRRADDIRELREWMSPKLSDVAPLRDTGLPPRGPAWLTDSTAAAEYQRVVVECQV